MTAIPQEILNYIEIVEQEKYRTCNEQKLLVAFIRRIFEKEKLFYNEIQIEILKLSEILSVCTL